MFNNESNDINNKLVGEKRIKKALPKAKHLKNTNANQFVNGGQGSAPGTAASGTSQSFICSVCATC